MRNVASKSVELVKKAALDAVASTMPSGVYYGTVTSIAPLKIALEQKLVLTDKQLVLSSLVKDFAFEMTVDHETETESGGSGEAAFASHNHGYKGRKKYTIHLGLKVGEKVILIRVQGGQQFIVLDRVR